MAGLHLRVMLCADSFWRIGQRIGWRRNGSRWQSPPRPDDVASHCSRESKPHWSMWDKISVRQYSYVCADAGVEIEALGECRQGRNRRDAPFHHAANASRNFVDQSR